MKNEKNKIYNLPSTGGASSSSSAKSRESNQAQRRVFGRLLSLSISISIFIYTIHTIYDSLVLLQFLNPSKFWHFSYQISIFVSFSFKVHIISLNLISLKNPSYSSCLKLHTPKYRIRTHLLCIFNLWYAFNFKVCLKEKSFFSLLFSFLICSLNWSMRDFMSSCELGSSGIIKITS